MASKIVTDDLKHLDALCFILQAKAVSEVAFRNADKRGNEYWGLHVLIESVNRDVYATVESETEENYEKASCSLAGAVSLIGAYNHEADDELLMAVETLLHLAKQRIDDAWEALDESQPVVA